MPIEDCQIPDSTVVWHPETCNLYGCKIGERCSIGAGTEIGNNVIIGDDCAIGAHCFIPEGVTIGKNVWIGPGVTFGNDKYPPTRKRTGKWEPAETIVEDDVVIGMRAVIMPGIRLGKGCRIGAGSLVTQDIEPGYEAWGHPAQRVRKAEIPDE